MDFPLDKRKKELILYLIDESYKYYEQKIDEEKEKVIEGYRKQDKEYKQMINILSTMATNKQNIINKRADDEFANFEKKIDEEQKRRAEIAKGFQPKKTNDFAEAIEEVKRIKKLCLTVDRAQYLNCMTGYMAALGQVEKLTSQLLSRAASLAEPVKKSKEVIIKPISDGKVRSNAEIIIKDPLK